MVDNFLDSIFDRVHTFAINHLPERFGFVEIAWLFISGIVVVIIVYVVGKTFYNGKNQAPSKIIAFRAFVLVMMFAWIFVLFLGLPFASELSESLVSQENASPLDFLAFIKPPYPMVLYMFIQPRFCIFVLGAVVCICVILFVLTRLILGRQPKISNTFWEHQRLARGKVIWLYCVFISMLILICITALSLFMLIFSLFQPEFIAYHEPIHLFPSYSVEPKSFHPKNYEIYICLSLALSLGLVAVIFVAYLVKSLLMARHSIDTLAKTLQATEITDSTRVLSTKEKMLVNVVEEMAIASQMPLPRVFIMREEHGVNAMCSGERFGKADEKIAIFVTQGALDIFNRNELQGVIGHEFSHAFHQDVALNLKLFSMVFALTCVVLVGEVIVRFIGNSSSNRSSSKDSGKGVAVIALIGVVFIVLGYIGSIFAQIIQAAISRQKEFLADASSVQYTRNPNSIESALQKLANPPQTLDSTKPTYIKNPKAKPCAHMFFFSGFSSIFATHPPLQERIKRLHSINS